jgi:hypothetical protein
VLEKEKDIEMKETVREEGEGGDKERDNLCERGEREG